MLWSGVCLRHKTCQKKSPDRWTGHSYDLMWSEWCCDRSCHQKIPFDRPLNLSPFRNKMASWTKWTVTDWGCPYGWAAFPFSVTRVAPVPHGCPAPRPAPWRDCPSAQRKQNLSVMWIIRSSLTHPPGSACPSGTPPPGCTWWVKAEARTEVEKRRHTSGKNTFFNIKFI